MSEAATRTGTGPTWSAAERPRLLDSLDALLREWLPRQRWFAGKGHPVTGFGLVSATELLPPAASPGLLHLLVETEQPGQPPDCYQLLLGVRRVLPPHLAPALIGRPGTGPLTGLTVYEGLHDPRLAQLLLERLRIPGRMGDLHFERARGAGETADDGTGDGADDGTDGKGADAAGDAEIPPGLAARALGVEQSNSSLVYGDRLILKLFRKVVPGVQPDLEVPLALAGAGCARVPAPVAWFSYVRDAPRSPDGPGAPDDPDSSYALGVLQPYLAGSEDGWTLALRCLREGGDFVPQARELGRATAEVHQALAEALPTTSLGRPQTDLIATGMKERLHDAVRSVPALHPYAQGLASAYDALAALDGDHRTAQRVHGDLHLGQCLRSPDDTWHLIDFEGEPARPLAERRRPQPPVRDIAGMLRSFEYAAHTHRAPAWASSCRAAYCTGYAEVMGVDPRDEPTLLRAYETDKAIYEVLYEARNRPDWLPVPMSAIRRLASPDH
ncbi:phosphotransferase [Streptomyces monticola]|uniref:Maltokinase n=1 Tax=Streptomyces monticola TaxID=2666263 RepID=A0ABW2JXG6_9ACTN